MNRMALLLLLAGHMGLVSAGGSGEYVSIEKLTVNGSDYELVVTPHSTLSPYQDPYMRDCRRLTVKGGYSRLLAWRMPESVSRKSHMNALSYLKQAQATNNSILLAPMGTGFVPIDAADKCTVRSRALELVHEHGEVTVLSYHDPL